MNRASYLPTKPSVGKCATLLGMLAFIWVLENSPVRSLIGIQVFDYIVRPILCIGIILIVLRLPRIHARTKFRYLGSLNGWAFIFSFIFIAVSFAAGFFIDGLGKNPYAQSIAGMFMNTLWIGTALITVELIRSYVINSLAKNENFLTMIVVAIFMTLMSIALKTVMNQKGFEELVKYLAQYVAPEFSHSLFATYLAFLGGPAPALIYMTVIRAMQWLSPVLPSLQWITAALVGVMCPVFFLTSMQSIYAKETKQLKAKDKDEEGVLSWIITSLVSIGIIWFSVGVFPIYPSVIATGSMEPMIMPGDVTLVRKITTMEELNRLKVGDVMQFKRGGIFITHRIIEVIETKNDGVKYRTKGDNNSGPDTELVKPQDVRGTIVYVVPKVGWPTLLVKAKDDVTDKVVF